ncbi:helix-turn-helix domain-containing protein [Nostoc sp. CHAB 5784]|uniref:helix-turn-helix domain-containing protein n=1 Tax=Nostoc mirabile TaxID=2907820 RepID=UPI0027E0EC8E|nr:helix-turn-helix domain-containing protein [Nostoc mirabile]MCC5670887.1 helix-turn-helix domain-containing protein [Nostoc mirabile CHAB5784]
MARTDTLVLTQEYIAKILGCRRTGVTEVATRLSRAGMISYRRGNITISTKFKLFQEKYQ